ncbi:hypothetical protein [Paraburkholderia caribensis]|uniref:hypothetical protein n=1 Tax=Paraburkholderia caribensis TaxID=75105 RepID=UPI003F499F15
MTYGALHTNVAHLVFDMLCLFMFGAGSSACWGRVEPATLSRERLMRRRRAVARGPDVDRRRVSGDRRIGGRVRRARRLCADLSTQTGDAAVPPIPMPAWLFTTGYALIELLLGVSHEAPGVAHFAHLAGRSALSLSLALVAQTASRCD